MKANACMLPRVMCERCIGLCHKNDLKIKTTWTSCILCVHIHQLTSSFMMMSMDAYTIMMMMMIMPCMIYGGLLISRHRLRTTSSTMTGPSQQRRLESGYPDNTMRASSERLALVLLVLDAFSSPLSTLATSEKKYRIHRFILFSYIFSHYSSQHDSFLSNILRNESANYTLLPSSVIP